MIFLLLCDERYKKTYDDNFDEGHVIEKFADQSYFTWFKVKKVSVVSPRDFVLILHFNQMPDGTIYIMGFDAGNPDLVPEIKGLIRASVPVSKIFYNKAFRLEDGA